MTNNTIPVEKEKYLKFKEYEKFYDQVKNVVVYDQLLCGYKPSTSSDKVYCPFDDRRAWYDDKTGKELHRGCILFNGLPIKYSEEAKGVLRCQACRCRFGDF